MNNDGNVETSLNSFIILFVIDSMLQLYAHQKYIIACPFYFQQVPYNRCYTVDPFDQTRLGVKNREKFDR